MILILGRQPSLSIDDPRFSRQRLHSPDLLFSLPLVRLCHCVAEANCFRLRVADRKQVASLLRFRSVPHRCPSGVGFLRFVRSFQVFACYERKEERKKGKKLNVPRETHASLANASVSRCTTLKIIDNVLDNKFSQVSVRSKVNCFPGQAAATRRGREESLFRYRCLAIALYFPFLRPWPSLRWTDRRLSDK